MKKIVSIKTKEHEFILDELSSLYLFSSLYIFFLKENIVFSDNKKVAIKGNSLSELKDIISSSLLTLLSVSYTEPSIKEIQKHSTRFEKISISEKIYKVNYRMSESGRLAYVLYSLVNVLEIATINNEEILIS